MTVSVSAPGEITTQQEQPAIVALCMPHYGQVEFDAAEAYRQPTGPNSPITAVAYLGSKRFSILTRCFNRCWCAALNAREKGVTHFAMLHADVAAERGWLDVLFRELRRLEADVVSAVVPMKSEHGLTSTALGAKHPFLQRRLSMKEVYMLPETFSAADVRTLTGLSGPLLVNTGCWIADLRKPWVDEVDENGLLKWAFEFRDEIRKDPKTGKFREFGQSEDWLFSRYLASVGAKVYATRKVPLYHCGGQNFVNGRPWGTWDTDESFAEVMTELDLARAGENERHEAAVEAANGSGQLAIGVCGS